MESVDFYARLLYQANMLGGPQELSQAQVERLYEIRRQFGMTGKHPADKCPNAKAGKARCHSCGGSCRTASGNDAELIDQLTHKVMAQLGK